MKFLLSLPLFLFVFISTLYSQPTVKGVVNDDVTQETLPAATVLIEDTYRGTITNKDGQFELKVSEFPITILVRFIGYETESVFLDKLPTEPLIFSMERSITEMDEVVVTDRDPGLSIMEKVIERKKIWRANLKTYQAEAYTRQVMENDTSIVSITESGTQSFWDSEKGHREVQLYKRQTSNINADENFAGVRFLPNFYDDDIEISGFEVVGITNPNALSFYNFRLLETMQMDGKPVYKIEVIPRRKLQPTFEGVAYVDGVNYALLEVDLKPNDVVRFPPPVQEFDLAYKQQFSNYGGDFWLPVDMRINGTIRISMIGLRFPAIKFRQTSKISDYRINIELPDSLYREERGLVKADSSVVAKEFTSVETERIPLSREEEAAYAEIDSTNTLEKAFQPSGFLADQLENNENRNGLFGDQNLLPDGAGIRLGFNRVDGYQLGAGYEKRFNSFGMHAKIFSDYNTQPKTWDYGIRLDQQIISTSLTNIRILGGYENKTDLRYDSRLYSKFMNSFNTVLGGEDYFDYFKNERLFGGVSLERILPRTDVNFMFNHERHNSHENPATFDYSLFGWHATRRQNPAIEDGLLNSIEAGISYNVESLNYGFAGRRQFEIKAEFSDDQLGSDFSFTNLTFAADWSAETFYGRRLFANTLDVHFSAGYAFGELPPQRFGAVDGVLSRFTPFSALKTRSGVPYEGDRYWALSAEHNFRSIPFELLGLRSLSDRGWGIIVFGGAGYSEVSRKNIDFLPMVTDRVHTEAGVSLNSIFGILRIDFAKRLDRRGSFIGISIPRYF